MTQRSNSTRTVEIRFADGEVFGEKHRNTVGGFANMVRRIEQRIGERITSRMTGIEVEFTTTETGRSFRIAQVQSF